MPGQSMSHSAQRMAQRQSSGRAWLQNVIVGDWKFRGGRGPAMRRASRCLAEGATARCRIIKKGFGLVMRGWEGHLYWWSRREMKGRTPL
jgi:hypothetical protein